MFRNAALLIGAGLFCTAASAEGIDALRARLETADAERFAAVFDAHAGAPDAAALREGYLEDAGHGVEIFTPHRIGSARHLAATIAEHPEIYRRGIDVCLPAARAAAPDVRAIYLAFQGLLDDPELPRAYAVFGANNSGGTIGDGALVIGLEVVCRMARGDVDDVRGWLRAYLAHETVHTQQTLPGEAPSLLAAVLIEGGAEFIGSIVAGESLNPEVGRWADARGHDRLWARFRADMARDDELENYGPWLYSGQPEDWPQDVGYWLGARIAEAYYERATDKRRAVRDILAAGRNAEAFLEASGYAERFGER